MNNEILSDFDVAIVKYILETTIIKKENPNYSNSNRIIVILKSRKFERDFWRSVFLPRGPVLF